MILINRTFQEVTPESAEHGEPSDSGFIVENEPYTFRELVDALRTHSEPSDYPCCGDANTWFSTPTSSDPDDFETGMVRTESIHFSRANPPHAERYWRLAAVAAGVAHV